MFKPSNLSYKWDVFQNGIYDKSYRVFDRSESTLYLHSESPKFKILLTDNYATYTNFTSEGDPRYHYRGSWFCGKSKMIFL